MKTSIPKLAAATLFAAFATTVPADAGVRFANHGRAGYVVTREAKETRAAQAKAEPAKPVMKIQTLGRAGYRYSYERCRGR